MSSSREQAARAEGTRLRLAQARVALLNSMQAIESGIHEACRNPEEVSLLNLEAAREILRRADALLDFINAGASFRAWEQSHACICGDSCDDSCRASGRACEHVNECQRCARR